MHILYTKLKILKAMLKFWNTHSFGNIHDAASLANKNLKEVQLEIQNVGYSELLQEKEAMAQIELEKALNMEEKLWKEK